MQSSLGRVFGSASLVAACFAAACGAAPARARHISSICTDDRLIALTFDDGPNPPFTGQILDALEAAGAHATFFAEGQQVEAHPDVVRDELARGMAVGAHSYSHDERLPSMTRAEFAADLLKGEAALTAATGVRPVLYRSPYGHTSDTMLEEERKRGYTSIGWDIDAVDWDSSVSEDAVVTNVVDHAHPGAIVLMHDGGLGGGNPDRSVTVHALPRILAGLRDAGYAMVTVPELMRAKVAACSAN